MSSRLALYTFGVFIKPADDPANDGFYELNDPIMDVVDKAPGLIARSGYPDEPGPKPWGPEVYPRFYKEKGDGWSPATLSLWTDLESPMAFAYFGLHARALRQARDWFRKPEWPPLTLWWVDDKTTPTWSDAVARHKHLHEHGPTAHAFTFKSPYDSDGQPATIDRARVKASAAGS